MYAYFARLNTPSGVYLVEGPISSSTGGSCAIMWRCGSISLYLMHLMADTSPKPVPRAVTVVWAFWAIVECPLS
jgi:hypothetical protein